MVYVAVYGRYSLCSYNGCVNYLNEINSALFQINIRSQIPAYVSTMNLEALTVLVCL